MNSLAFFVLFFVCVQGFISIMNESNNYNTNSTKVERRLKRN